jgi:hypothetical protein
MMRTLIPILLVCNACTVEIIPKRLLPSSDLRLTGITLVDQRGGTHLLGDESPGRLAMLFTVDQRFEAKRCDASLSSRLDPAAPLIRIIDAHEFVADERDTLIRRVSDAVGQGSECFLLDWDGAVRTRLGLGDAKIALIGFSAAGTVAGAIDGKAEAPVMTAVLGLVGRPVEPPFTADEFARVRKGR